MELGLGTSVAGGKGPGENEMPLLGCHSWSFCGGVAGEVGPGEKEIPLAGCHNR